MSKYSELQRDVERLLIFSPATRYSDKRLLIEYWQSKGMNLSKDQIETFAKLNSPETITRFRRKLQENGNYTANSQVTIERENRSEEIKEHMRWTLFDD